MKVILGLVIGIILIRTILATRAGIQMRRELERELEREKRYVYARVCMSVYLYRYNNEARYVRKTLEATCGYDRDYYAKRARELNADRLEVLERLRMLGYDTPEIMGRADVVARLTRRNPGINQTERYRLIDYVLGE